MGPNELSTEEEKAMAVRACLELGEYHTELASELAQKVEVAKEDLLASLLGDLGIEVQEGGARFTFSDAKVQSVILRLMRDNVIQ